MTTPEQRAKWKREDVRAENIARADAEIPSQELRRELPAERRVEGHPYLYRVPGEHALDERLLEELLRRVQELEDLVSGQQEVIKGLVEWRVSFAQRPPVAAQRHPPQSGASATAPGEEPPPRRPRPLPIERPVKRGFTDG